MKSKFLEKHNKLKLIILKSKDLAIPIQFKLNRAITQIKGLGYFRCNLVLLLSNLPVRLNSEKLSLYDSKALNLGLDRLNFALETDLHKISSSIIFKKNIDKQKLNKNIVSIKKLI